jgi:hypothetical protein
MKQEIQFLNLIIKISNLLCDTGWTITTFGDALQDVGSQAAQSAKNRLARLGSEARNAA